tara:strand:- start:251 stop:496 length:246 start_codon:yes stop_codon:yes gene_type:complete
MQTRFPKVMKISMIRGSKNLNGNFQLKDCSFLQLQGISGEIVKVSFAPSRITVPEIQPVSIGGTVKIGINLLIGPSPSQVL